MTDEMDMRDHIAAVAMSGLCANPGGPFQADAICGWSITNCTPLQVAEECYRLADAMLEARKQKP